MLRWPLLYAMRSLTLFCGLNEASNRDSLSRISDQLLEKLFEMSEVQLEPRARAACTSRGRRRTDLCQQAESQLCSAALIPDPRNFSVHGHGDETNSVFFFFFF